MALTPSQVEHYRRVLVASSNECAVGVVRAEAEVAEQDDLGRYHRYQEISDLKSRVVGHMQGGAPSRVVL
jgi:hypothetical protein